VERFVCYRGLSVLHSASATRLPKNGVERAFLASFVAVQLVHVAVVLLFHHPRLASNFIQTAMATLALLLCAYYSRAAREKQDRWRWVELSTAFLIWLFAQAFYLANMLTHAPRASVPLSDGLWLFFALPFLLIASGTSSNLNHDPVRWLDTAQACLFFVLVFALVYPQNDVISTSTAYNIQSFALLLVFSIRYSIAKRSSDRVFYRNLAIFSTLYSTCNAIGYSVWGQAFAGAAIDLFWTVPFTGFGYMMIRANKSRQVRPGWATRMLAPTYLHGVSALGLAIMSLVSSAILARHHHFAGALAVAISFLLFAARTSTREWQLSSAQIELKHSALHDPLTGLPNRRMLHQELSALLRRIEAAPAKHVALLFIDLDRFKTINDALGHAFGDRLLSAVSGQLCSAARPQDVVGRQGGDEFLILLDDVEPHEAETIAQRVLALLHQPLLVEQRHVQVTASIGIVLSGDGSTADDMLQDADCAMYKAKGLGKDRAEIFAPNMLAKAKWKLELETALRQSLAGDGIDVHYQPLFFLPDMRVRGFEALARWRHPVLGTIGPSEFIPVAEDTGLIVDLGRQVLEKACHQCRAWNDRFSAQLLVSVNVSAHQFASSSFLDDVVRILSESGLEPNLLKLEITESALIANYDAVEDVLMQARALGIAICLDDFGTGYSSLSYLLRFPFDVIKIDRSFVRHLDGDYRRSAMVRMINELAATLGKRIIVEGVETEAELLRLRELGCEMVQGFLLSKPLTPAAVEALLLGGGTVAAAFAVEPAVISPPWQLDATRDIGPPLLGVTSGAPWAREIVAPAT
jgi:diguanylate cyclase (GGDEF)-like protein